MSTELKTKSYSVGQYDPNGLLLKEFNSYQHASEESGVKTIYIQQVCYGKKNSAGGFIWRKGPAGELPDSVAPLKRTRPTRVPKPVRQRTLSGEFVAIYASVNKAAKAVGRGRKDVQSAAAGRQKTCAGCIWDFVKSEDLVRFNLTQEGVSLAHVE